MDVLITPDMIDKMRGEVVDVAESLAAENPHLEFSAWVDGWTEHVICRVSNARENAACAYALTHRGMRDGTYKAEAAVAWANMIEEMNRKPIDPAYRTSAPAVENPAIHLASPAESG